MRQAASAFLASLTPEQREAAIGSLTDPARTTWTYLPGNRKGVSLGQLEDEQKARATALLRSALSERGHWQATTVMQLEQGLPPRVSCPLNPVGSGRRVWAFWRGFIVNTDRSA